MEQLSVVLNGLSILKGSLWWGRVSGIKAGCLNQLDLWPIYTKLGVRWFVILIKSARVVNANQWLVITMLRISCGGAVPPDRAFIGHFQCYFLHFTNVYKGEPRNGLFFFVASESIKFVCHRWHGFEGPSTIFLLCTLFKSILNFLNQFSSPPSTFLCMTL